MDGQQIKEEFLKNGYMVIPTYLTENELSDLRMFVKTELLKPKSELPPEQIAAHWNEPGFLFEDENLYKIQSVYKYFPPTANDSNCSPSPLDTVFRNSKVLDYVRLLLNEPTGTEISIFGTKFFPMPPKIGRSVSWHQDSHFFGATNSRRILSMGVYLDNTNVENGCISVIPGTHKLQDTPINDTVSSHKIADGIVQHGEVVDGMWKQGEWITDIDRLCAQLNTEANTSQVQEFAPIDLEVPAGTIVLFDARLVHGANTNVSESRSRWSFFGHYVRSDFEFRWRGVDFSIGKYSDRWPLSG